MVFEGGLGGTRRERAASDEVFDELVVGRERRDVEGDGVLSNKGDVGGFNGRGGHWSEERMVSLRRPRLFLFPSIGHLWWYLVISSGAKI